MFYTAFKAINNYCLKLLSELKTNKQKLVNYTVGYCGFPNLFHWTPIYYVCIITVL